jgi:hypothetical protein
LAKTIDEIIEEVNALSSYTGKTKMSPTPHLWNEQGIKEVLQDIVALLSDSVNGVQNLPLWTPIMNLNPNFDPNTDLTDGGARRYAGTWELVQPGLVPYTGTDSESDYQLTVPQIKSILSSYRNISGANLPSTRFPLGGTTGEPSDANGAAKNMNWSVDFAIPIADWSHAINVLIPSGNISRAITPSPRLLPNAMRGWGAAGDKLVHNGSHRHTLKEGYVQFNTTQSAFDVRQAGFVWFVWVRTA